MSRRSGRARTVILVAGVVALAGLAGMMIHVLATTTVLEYASYNAAATDSTHGRGWLPAFVPHSAIQMRAAYDAGSKEQWLRFRAGEPELRAMVAPMEALASRDIDRNRSSPPRWSGPWPPELTFHPEGAPRGTSLLSYHRTIGSGAGARCVAVEWQAGLAYAWSC